MTDTEARDALTYALAVTPRGNWTTEEKWISAILAALDGWTLVPVDTVARLTESLKWPLTFPCFREDDDDCQAHAAEWPFGNDVCEWVLQARAALGASDDE
jgi:hypothetical protein